MLSYVVLISGQILFLKNSYNNPQLLAIRAVFTIYCHCESIDLVSLQIKTSDMRDHIFLIYFYITKIHSINTVFYMS